jgi:hypothetical protein
LGGGAQLMKFGPIEVLPLAEAAKDWLKLLTRGKSSQSR